MSHPKQGEIYWADLNPTQGVETRGVRPVLVLSRDEVYAKPPQRNTRPSSISRPSMRLDLSLSL